MSESESKPKKSQEEEKPKTCDHPKNIAGVCLVRLLGGDCAVEGRALPQFDRDVGCLSNKGRYGID